MSGTSAAEPARPRQGSVVVPLDVRRPRAGRPAGARTSSWVAPRPATPTRPPRPALRLLPGGGEPAGALTLERFLARGRLVLTEDARSAEAGAEVLPLRRRA